MSSRAEIRADFIKRLFAVAISIGVATSFVGMDWVKQGSWPKPNDWERLFILAVGLFATVLSWDGYLASIESKKLNGAGRFSIDIILVFIYMFFLISSGNPNLWLPILAVVYALYVWWDVLTVREHIGKYDTSLKPASANDSYRAPFGDVLRVYWRGFLDNLQTDRGPIITLSWAVFFLSFALLNYVSTTRHQVFFTCAFAFAGLALYRHDKTKISESGVRGYRMSIRALLVASLLACAAIYFCRFSIGPSSSQ